MSEEYYLNKNQGLKADHIIAIQDIILEYILSNHWKDYRNFARSLSEKILIVTPKDESSIVKILKKFSHPFFSFNEVSRNAFAERFPCAMIIHRMKNMPEPTDAIKKVIVVSKQQQKRKDRVTFDKIFPEIKKIDLETAKSLVDSLDIRERIIQNALRDALREKGATNMVERKSDSSLEIADLEDFTLEVNGQMFSFTSVVKGHRSISKSKISFEDIAHQVVKANITNPDHILLILAKPTKNGIITHLVKYGIDCGNRNLIILVDQVNLARFLRARAVI